MGRSIRHPFAVLAALALAAAAHAQVPTAVRRVADIRTEPTAGGSFPTYGPATDAGSTVVLAGVANELGMARAWTTDGTSAGTRPLPLPTAFWYAITAGTQAGRALLVAQDLSYGSELWATDGTAAGTTLLKDLAPGPQSGNPWRFTSMGGLTYFTSTDEWTWSVRLWRTDGTSAGTEVVRPLNVTSDLVALGSSLVFAAEEAEGSEPWISDGTAAGTRLLKDLASGAGSGSFPSGFTPFGSLVAFTAANTGTGAGWQPFITDGTEAGTLLLADVSVPFTSLPAFGADGARAFFAADDGVSGLEPWLTDGTPAGTARIADLRPGPTGSVSGQVVAWNGRAYFAADDGASGSELWVSDGTLAGTALLADVRPGPDGSSPVTLVATAWGVMFVADDGVSGREPWITDGTPAGTVRLADAEPGPGSSDGGGWRLAGGLAYAQICTTSTGCEPWVSDGTPAGTRLLADLGPTQSPSAPRSLLVADGRVHFIADDGGAHGAEPWSTDGTASGTRMTVDFAPGSAWSSFSLQSASDDRVFARDDRTMDAWSIAEGVAPELLGNLTREGFDPQIAALPSGAAFCGRDATAGLEPMASDGTSAGTRLLRDVEPGPAGTDAVRPVTVGDRILFICNPTTHAAGPGQIGSTDLTDAGTTFFVPAAEAIDSRFTRAVGRDVLFRGSSSTATLGWEPWLTDGTPAGTRALGDLNPGPDSTWLVDAAPFGGGFLFAADAGAGIEPWFSDGTAAGTVSLGDLLPGPRGSVPIELTDAGTFGLFVANDGVTGYELWRTDGTPAGTSLVVDLVPGLMGSSPRELLVYRPGLVIFVATDAARGRELWVTDGTAAGTQPWTEVNPGPGDALPAELVLCDGQVFFSADDGDGRELFVLGDPPPVENCANAQDDDGDGASDCADADCIADPACTTADTDGDGVPNGSDCAPADPSAFAVPAELQDVEVSTDATGATVLEWPDPRPAAGTGTLADVVTAALSDLQSWSCLGMGLTSPATDSRPGSWAYRVRASNACGPPPDEGWGTASDGSAPAASCP